MSTANVQNLLSNVFHPTFYYDTTNKVYQSKLELVNIDTVSANTVSTFAASVGDANNNVYVGIGAGNPHSNLVSSSNSNNTFVGAYAGASTSNVQYATFIGYQAGKNTIGGVNTIAIGNSAFGAGSNNIHLGTSVGLCNSGNCNVIINPVPLSNVTFALSAATSSNQTYTGLTGAISPGMLVTGAGISTTITVVTVAPSTLTSGTLVLSSSFTSTSSTYTAQPVTTLTNQLLVGPLTASPHDTYGVANYLLGGNFSCNYLGVNLSNPSYTLDVNGYGRIGTNQNGGLGINTNPYDATLNVNGSMKVSDGYGVMTFGRDSNGISRTVISGIVNPAGVPPSVGTATMQVSDGFFSVSGTITIGNSGTSTIGQWKKGNVLIAVRDASGAHYVSGMYLCTNPTTPTTYLMTNSTKDADTSIVSSTSNIQISNNWASALTYTYAITYFPLP
jgi:hypothetical protein